MKHSSIRRMQSLDFSPVVFSYMKSLDCPRSLTVWLMFRYKEHQQLSELSSDPCEFIDQLSFHKAHLATKFLSKYNGLDVPYDRRERALSAFFDAERTCELTNQRLDKRIFPNLGVEQIISSARRKIYSLIGDVDSVTLEKIFSKSRFGPGVTTSHKGKWLSPYEKLDHRGQATTVLAGVLRKTLRLTDYPNWSGIHHPETVLGNTVLTVPKNSKIDRTIAVEPVINAFFQRGVGNFFRSRLNRWGVDLTDQTRNQDLAKAGSLSGNLATVDLAAASDTVSIGCIDLLFPKSWVTLLNVLRSPCFTLAGETKRYHKHSSMGNGYTFELESIVFSAVVLSILSLSGTKDVEWSVYGDDIILPSQYTDLLYEVLHYLGFSPNLSKSFSSGYFRESCGADWYNGVQCTPFYYKRKDDIVQWITFANWLRCESPDWLDISELWKFLYLRVPKDFAIRGPANSSYLCFYVNESEFDPFSVNLRRRPYGPVLGYKLRGVDFVPASRSVQDMPRALAGSLYTLELLPCNAKVIPVPLYRRVSMARGIGCWKVRSYVYDLVWPTIRYLS